MSRRDTYIVTVIAALAAVAAFWLLALSPKREKLSALDKDVASAEQARDQAKQEKVKFAQDQVAFPRLYASLGRLGKAVPADEDVPSLLVQLNHAAAKANVNFHSVELKMDLAEKIEQTAAASASASAGGSATPPAGAEAGAAAPAGEGAQAQAPAPAGEAAPAGGDAAPAGGTAAPAGGTAAPAGGATASAGATAGAPAPGATPSDPGTPSPAAAAFKALPFEYKFRGDFFDLEDLIHNVTRLVERRNQELAITGRLITIQGFAMKRGRITVLATTYMLPADQGLLAGASPQGPAVDPAAPQAAAAGSATPAPPTAAVTTP
jgi:hypothetical protein